MTNRGLYGQSESDAGSINAQSQRFADVVGEGLKTTDGSYTEQGFRVRLGKAAQAEMDASRGERKAVAQVDTPELIKMIEVRGYVGQQKAALDAQGDIAQEMKDAGFAQSNIFQALALAAPTAYAAKEVVGGMRGAEDPGAKVIRVRSKPRMYAPERDSLVNPDGSVKLNQRGLYEAALAAAKKVS